MGRWLVGGGVEERGGSEMINNGTYLGRECEMGDGVWSSEFVDVVFGCVFAGLLV